MKFYTFLSWGLKVQIWRVPALICISIQLGKADHDIIIILYFIDQFESGPKSTCGHGINVEVRELSPLARGWDSPF